MCVRARARVCVCVCARERESASQSETLKIKERDGAIDTVRKESPVFVPPPVSFSNPSTNLYQRLDEQKPIDLSVLLLHLDSLTHSYTAQACPEGSRATRGRLNVSCCVFFILVLSQL